MFHLKERKSKIFFFYSVCKVDVQSLALESLDLFGLDRNSWRVARVTSNAHLESLDRLLAEAILGYANVRASVVLGEIAQIDLGLRLCAWSRLQIALENKK